MLEWSLEWGAHKKKLQHAAKNVKNVKALENKPEVEEHLVDYWNAFISLDSGRAPGQAISAADVLAYADLAGFEGENRLELFELVKALDSKYLAWRAEKEAAKHPRRGHGGKSKSRNRRNRGGRRV